MTPPAASPPDAASTDLGAAAAALRGVAAQWRTLELDLADLLREGGSDELRLGRIRIVGQQVLDLLQERPDEALFVIFQTAADKSPHYSAAHALACVAVTELAAQQLAWTDDERGVLTQAGLTMNISITALQDELAHRERPLTGDQRIALAHHPQRSAERLRALGVSDPLWLAVVERHHSAPDRQHAPPETDAAERVADLLRRTDLFLAKLSARASRKALPAHAAIRSACLGGDGRPDRTGEALLRVLGFYPPGTWVRLASGELGVVLRRGARADQPQVLRLLDQRRRPLPPRLGDTAAPERAAVAALGAGTLYLPRLLDTLFARAPQATSLPG